MCVSYFVQYKKEHAVKASVLLAQGKKKRKEKITKCREKMAWPTIEIILLYNETNSCLSSTIEKVVYSAKVWQRFVSEKLV